MTFINRLCLMLLGAVLLSAAAFGQQAIASGSTTVPRLVNFSGKATDAQGKAISGIAGGAFAIYKDQHEGSPLWLETHLPCAPGNLTLS